MRSEIDETHDPSRLSWVESANDHIDFPVQNLPLGIFSTEQTEPRPGVAIGDRILDLLAVRHLLPDTSSRLLDGGTLNAMFSASSKVRRDLRRRVFALLTDESARGVVEPGLLEAAECVTHLPAAIGDYTDFYAGIHHAEHAGQLFRPDAPLEPNYKWVPIGYHGRSSSVLPSGTGVVRPKGQCLSGTGQPVFQPCRELDFELEMAVWIGPGNKLGEPVLIENATDHIVGLGLLNDWSARDVQMWEMRPLGPFLAKNFQTTVSPWVVTLEALAPFRTARRLRQDDDPSPLPYLHHQGDQESGAFQITLEIHLLTARMREVGLHPFRLAQTEMASLYWTIGQLVAHHTSGGCNLRAGDLLGTGTISQANDENSGCLLEITRGGQRMISLPDGEERIMLEDGDEVIFTAIASAEGYRPIGFGECRGQIQPAGSMV